MVSPYIANLFMAKIPPVELPRTRGLPFKRVRGTTILYLLLGIQLQRTLLARYLEEFDGRYLEERCTVCPS